MYKGQNIIPNKKEHPRNGAKAVKSSANDYINAGPSFEGGSDPAVSSVSALLR
jgi:hypothetical protein